MCSRLQFIETYYSLALSLECFLLLVIVPVYHLYQMSWVRSGLCLYSAIILKPGESCPDLLSAQRDPG